MSENIEKVCTDAAMAQWESSLKRPDLSEKDRVRGAVEAYKRQAFAFAVIPAPLPKMAGALRLAREWLPSVEAHIYDSEKFKSDLATIDAVLAGEPAPAELSVGEADLAKEFQPNGRTGMTKINLWDQASHPLAKSFYDLTCKVEQLGTGVEFTNVTLAVSQLLDLVQNELNAKASAASSLEDISDLATVETDAGPVFNRAFLDSDENFDRFMSIISGSGSSRPVALAKSAEDIIAERQRQISVENWSPDRDDLYTDNQLARAAACYSIGVTAYWPWDMAWWKPSRDRRRNLVKAGALILAEIERLDRLSLSASEVENG